MIVLDTNVVAEAMKPELPNCPLTDPGVRNYRTGLFKTARVALGTYMIILREHDRYEAWQFQNNCAAL